jgi:hypothetical protein
MQGGTETEKTDIFEGEMVLSETMRMQLAQMCTYARIEGIDLSEIKRKLTDEGLLPCSDKTASKKALAEIYRHVACSF